MTNSLCIGRAFHGTLAGPLPVGDGLGVKTRLRVVLREQCRLGLHRHWKPLLEYLDNPPMDLLPRAMQQRLIRDFLVRMCLKV